MTALSPAIGQQVSGSGFTADTGSGGGISAIGQQPSGGGTPAGTGSGLSVILGVQSSLRYDENLGLDDPSRGDTTRLSNKFSLGVRSDKPNEQLKFDIDGLLRFADRPRRGSEFGFEDPSTSLSYARQSANSQFSGNASFREVDLDFFRPLRDTNLDGVIDESDLVDDDGNREDTRLNLKLQTGVNDPLGFIFELRHRDRHFTGTANPNLFDTETRVGSVTSLLRFSQVTQGRVQVRFTDYEAGDTRLTDRETTDVIAGVTHQFSPITTVDATVGFSRVDENFRAFGVSDTDTGATGSLSVTRVLPNGSAGVSVDRAFGANRDRTTVQVSRSMTLPSGSLSFSAGATRGARGNITAIGTLNFTHDLARSQISGSLARRVSTSSLTNEVRTTTANLGYSVTVNPVSNIALDLFYAENTDAGIGNASDRERGSFLAAYNYNLTRDWGLSLGYEFRVRKESGQGTATANAIFLTLKRQFVLKP